MLAMADYVSIASGDGPAKASPACRQARGRADRRLARDRIRTVRTPGGDIDALLPPVETAGQHPAMGPVPAFGEHTEAVRAEFGIPRRGSTP
jgi:crotonobetainyl-CoA:carnitine CoA-transferase CaiB-like acyl-CoA transferase